MNPQTPDPTQRRAKAPDRTEKTFVSRRCGHDEKLTQEARGWLERLNAKPVAAQLSVVWNPKLQTTAGTACVPTARIELNPRLEEIGAEQVRRTLKHEAAHLLAHFRAGRRSSRIQTHGKEWRQACKDLDISGEPAFHDLPFKPRQVARRFFYQCPSCATVVHRVRKFSRYTACYKCCKRFNGGVYNQKYEFIRIDAPVANETKTE